MIKQYLRRLLFNTTKKKLIFIGLFTLCSCGKKPTQNNNNDDGNSKEYLKIEKFNLNSTWDGQNTNYNESESYQFAANAFVVLPATLQVVMGDTTNSFVNIRFNYTQERDDFYCLYKGTINTEHVYELQNCYIFDRDNDGKDEPLDFVPGQEVEIDARHFIRQTVISGKENTFIKVNGEYEVRWY